MTAITEEALSVSGILLSKVFNRADAEVERYREANREQARLQVEQAMTGRAFFATVQAFFAITPALLYLAAGLMINGGTASLTAGTLVAFTTLQARLQMPLLQLMRVTLDVQTSLALFRRIFEYLDLVPAITERPGATTLDGSTLQRRDRVPRRLVPVPRAARAQRHGQPRPLRRHRRPHRASDESRPRRRAGDVRLGAARRLVQGRARPAGRDRRAVRRGQDHHDLPGAAVLRRHRGRGPHRRPRRPRPHARLGVRGRRHGHPGAVPVPRHDPRQHRLRQARRHARPRSSRPPATRTSTTGSSASPTATRPSPASAATGCPAARSSGSPSPGCC